MKTDLSIFFKNLFGSKVKPEGKQMDRSCPNCGRSHQVLYIYKGAHICELCWNSMGVKIKH